MIYCYFVSVKLTSEILLLILVKLICSESDKQAFPFGSFLFTLCCFLCSLLFFLFSFTFGTRALFCLFSSIVLALKPLRVVQPKDRA